MCSKGDLLLHIRNTIIHTTSTAEFLLLWSSRTLTLGLTLDEARVPTPVADVHVTQVTPQQLRLGRQLGCYRQQHRYQHHNHHHHCHQQRSTVATPPSASLTVTCVHESSQRCVARFAPLGNTPQIPLEGKLLIGCQILHLSES
ncbi:unnamed protein product [Ceratitis capitata]|uniref:(Mediterranean fruit fly) hypothetical protein n=1 Tax=Ceratitis capitata TaxID=7213 RepID=A0A811UGA1_CERCA|nr:unnamed protein product [Ceratitis capitata]